MWVGKGEGMPQRLLLKQVRKGSAAALLSTSRANSGIAPPGRAQELMLTQPAFLDDPPACSVSRNVSLVSFLQEAEAASEALQAERAAKYAADEEARQLQRMLDEVGGCERGHTAMV
jgi:hypothetical protein